MKGLMKKIRFNSGFTLAEVLVTTILFTILFGACVSILLSGFDSWQVGRVETELQQDLRRSLDKLRNDLQQSGASQVTGVPADGSTNTSISFKVSTGVTSGAIVWSTNAIQYALSAKLLQRTQGATVTTIARNIQTFSVSRQSTSPDIVTITLVAQKTTEKGRSRSKTLTFEVQMRNN